jgi:hypothetical protein
VLQRSREVAEDIGVFVLKPLQRLVNNAKKIYIHERCPTTVLV